MRAYKLLSVRKDGTLAPLFINTSQRIPLGEWLSAEPHPTKGYAYRPGWHCTVQPKAPHLAMQPKGRRPRVWAEVELSGTQAFIRPEAQGGTWILARFMKVTRLLSSSGERDEQQILQH